MPKIKKDKPVKGKYVSQKSEDELKKAQKKRLLFMYLSTLTVAVILFLPQEWAEFFKSVTWLQSLYVVLIITIVVVSVIASFGANRKCNITKPIEETYKPKHGFEKGTFRSVEWFVIIHLLLAAAQIALFVYGTVNYGAKPFDILCAALACAGAALAYCFRQVTFRALKDNLTYVPPPTAVMPDNEKADGETENTKTE